MQKPSVQEKKCPKSKLMFRLIYLVIVSVFFFLFLKRIWLCLKEKAGDAASKISAGIGGNIQHLALPTSAPVTVKGRMLQLLSNFIPVDFPQIACPVF